MTKQAHDIENVDSVIRSICIFLVIGFAAVLLWAWKMELDVVSLASGTVVPAGKVRTVQHLEGGIVRNILVEEGDTVNEGDPLVELESVARGSEFGELSLRVTTLQADIARLEAEAGNTGEIVFPEGFEQAHPQLAARSRQLLESSLASLKAELEGQKSEMTQREEQVREISTRIRKARERLEFVQEQVAINEELLKKKLSNRYEHLNLLKEVNSLESQIQEGRASLAQAKAALHKAKNEYTHLESNKQEKLQTKLKEKRSQLAEFGKRLEKFKDSLERTTLRAPVSGTVKTLYMVTLGGVIRPGGAVLDIVPSDDRLIVEAKLPPQEVGYVRSGQKAFIQLASSDASRLGKIDGHVVQISPDTLVEKNGMPYYLVKVVPEKGYFGEGHSRFDLYPGVLVSAGIVTGKRSVLEYILSPFMQNAMFAFTER